MVFDIEKDAMYNAGNYNEPLRTDWPSIVTLGEPLLYGIHSALQ